MAGKIQGITIKLKGDTTELQASLNDVNKKSSDLSKELRQVNNSLKFNPGNTELLAQKQRILAESVENTRKKVDLLKQAQKEAADQLERGEIGQDEYDKLTREVIKAENQLQSFEKELKKISSSAKEVGEAMQKTGDKMKGAGENLSKAVTVPIMAMGAGAIAAFNDVDEGLDIIVKKTGATGEAFDELETTFRNVFGSMPNTAEEVGNAVGEVNTQFGWTGEKLDEMSILMLKFAEITDSDVTSATIAAKGAMEKFGLEADKLPDVLDAIAYEGQRTGVSADKLFDSITKGSPQLKDMGLSFEESAALIANFEQKGVDSAKMIGFLTRAQTNWAKEGKSMQEGLAELGDELANATTEEEKLALAAEHFGVRGGSAMKEMLDELGISLDDVGIAAGDSAGTVIDTWDGVQDPIDRAKVAFNNLKLAGSDLGSAIQETLAPIMEIVVEKLQQFAEWFRNLSPEMQTTIVVIGGVVAAIGPLLVILGTVISSLGSLITFFAAGGAGATAFGTVVAALTGPVGIAVAAIAGLVAAGVALYKNWDTVKQKATELKAWISEKWGQIKEAVSGAITGAASAVSTKAQEIATVVQTKFENARKWATDKIEALKSGVTSKFESAKSAVSDKAQSIATTIRDKFDNARQNASEKFDAIKTVVTEKMEAAKTAASQKADQLKEAAVKAFEGLRQGAKDKIDAAKKAITDGIESARQAVAGYVTRFKSVGTEIINGIASGIRNGIRAVTDAARNVAKRALDAAKNFLGIRSPSKKMKREVGEMITEGMADGIVAKKADVGKAMQDITDHVLKNIEPLTETFEREGMLMEEVFANLKQGGTVAMEELFNTMALLQDYGYDSTEMARIFGPAWSEALQMIVWNMTGWDVQTMRTTYNLDEMNKAFAAMLGVGTSGTEGMKADLEDLGTTAEAVAKQSEKAILQHLGTLKAYVAGNKAAFVASMDQLLGAGEDVWNNIVHGGSGANGVIASVINRLSGISDEAKRTALAGQAFGDHWKSALNGMIQEVGMWQSEYNVGSWAIDQNKLLSLSLEEVKAAADKVKESISAESFAEPIKEDAIKTVKDKMQSELGEIESFTKETLDGIAKDFDDTFEKIRATVTASLKEKVIPAMRDAFKLGLAASDEFNQFVFDDFNHTFYELRDVIVVNLRNHVTPALKAQLETMLRVMESYTQGFFNSGLGWMRALAQGIRSGMVDVGAALNALPRTEGGGGVQWYDKGGIFKSPTVIGVGEKRPEFVGALDDLKAIVAEVIDRKGVSTAEGVVITGNTFNVRTDDDIRRIAEELQRLSDRNKRGGN